MNMKCKKPAGIFAVLFDLDGTLLDSVSTIIIAARIVYEKMNIPFVEKDVRRLIGIPLKDQARMIAGNRASEFIDLYRDVYRSLPDTGLFDGTIETLECLRNSNYRLSVVTSKVRKSAMRTLDATGLTRLFECIITADDVSRPKPNSEPVLKALKLMDISADQALFVGDSIHDIKCAHSADVKITAVSWGAMSAEDLSQAKADWVFDKWQDFRSFLCEKY